MVYRRSPLGLMDTTRILQDVRQVAENVLGNYDVDVYLFGSWANGTQRRTSDIDVAIDPHRPLPPGTLSMLRERFEESTIPYFVDVVDLSEVGEEFRARVHREGIRWSA